MKKYLLILAVAAYSFTAKAQIPIVAAVPGADGFEVWHADPLSSIMDPNNGNTSTPQWECLNLLHGSLFGGDSQTVFQDSNTVYSGRYSCRIRSEVFSSSNYNTYLKSFVPHDTMGIVLGATITFSPSPNIVPGIPFIDRIVSLSFYYQYIPQNNSITLKPDTAYCSVTMTHKHNVLGGGLLKMNATSGSWVKGTVTIAYDSSATHMPDTIDVLFSSSSFVAPVPHSELIIDAGTTLGVNDNINAVAANVDVYPNPASTQVNFRVSGSGVNAYGIEVYDITGKKISTIPVKDNMASVNTSAYAPGLYIYQMYDKSGALMKVGKFSIDK